MKKILYSLTLLFSFLTVVKAENILKIYVNRPKEAKGTIVYQITHEYNGAVERIEVEGDYKEIIFPEEDTAITIIEVDRPYYFEINDSVYYFAFSDDYTPELRVDVTLKNILFTFKTNYYSLKDQQEKEEYVSSFQVLDANQAYLQDVFYNSILLEYGAYYLQDTNTLKLYYFDYQNPEVNAYRYLIDGLKVNTKIESICQIDKCYEFRQVADEITFTEDIYPGYYIINGQGYYLEENSEAIQTAALNIIYLDDVPILEEETPEEQLPDVPSNPQDPPLFKEDEDLSNPLPDQSLPEEDDTLDNEVKDYEVQVPNTGLETNDIIYYLDKKYFY